LSTASGDGNSSCPGGIVPWPHCP